MDSKTLETFFNYGVNHKGIGGQAISINKPNSMWFLSEGEVNLFAIEKESGPRHLIASIKEGELIFGIETSADYPLNLEIIPQNDCSLFELPLKELDKINSQLIQNWILHLSCYFRREIPIKIDFEIQKEKEFLIDGDKTVRIKPVKTNEEKKNIWWIEVQEGRLHLFGDSDLILSSEYDPFPLTYNEFLQTDKKAKFCVKPTDLSTFSLKSFHAILLKEIVKRLKKEQQDQACRFLNKKKSVQEQFTHRIGGLNALLSEPEKKISIETKPLFRAIQALGKHLKISFQFLQKKSSIEEICESSGINYRKIQLDPEWWKQDGGDFLAFYKESEKPVALIYRGLRGYEMIDGETLNTQRVTSKNAPYFSTNAFVFFRPFPFSIKTGWDVIKFFFKRHFDEIIPLSLLILAASLFTLFPPLAISYLFNSVIPDSNKAQLINISYALILVSFSYSGLYFLQNLILVRIQGKGSAEIQTALWDRLFRLPVYFFRNFTVGNLFLRVSAFDQLRIILSDNIARIFLSGIISLPYVVLLVYYAPLLAVVMMGVLLIVVAFAIIYTRKRMKLEKEIADINGKLNGALFQILKGLAAIRVAGAEEPAFSYWANLFTQFKKRELKGQTYTILFNVIINMLPYISQSLIFGAFLFYGSLSIGSIMAFFAAFVSLSTFLSQLSTSMLSLSPAIPLWQRTKPLFETQPEISSFKESPTPLSGLVEITGLSFHYRDTKTPIIKDLTLEVFPKQMVAIVGPSGCGKSTLVRLLLGFEVPDEGGIYYDKKDLNHLNLQKVRQQIGCVLQGGTLASGTIYDNIVCGNPYTKEEVKRAVHLSGFEQDLENLPMGYHTFLPIGGGVLSGGQEQRLLIARALVSSPSTLIFDEATSALDNHTQALISENLDRLDVTRIMIAHRLSTVRNADKIYYMDKGTIIAEGNFEELASTCPQFQSMLKRQAL